MNFLKTKITKVYLKDDKLCMDLFQTAFINGEAEVRDVIGAIELPYNKATDKRTGSELVALVLTEEALQDLVMILNSSVRNETLVLESKEPEE